eukprot:CAMPEP_0171341030 /NCGR_PEP_ID=MMETSP0878-20121228/8921_1 /TAXON_ID=67004 /ORGANISM="Thalassiosira weissflogii, Strain CCMP1336" /LENGTH=527 /DNA_ID=CAMNT_0011843157 /DNA_START=67 /DNA_END=1650 /DNA_ORIENTATION=-
MKISPTTSILSALLCRLNYLASANDEQSYRVFPQRTSKEAAVIEWGHSAIISALDGAVATFGPQTSQGANFEVETSPVLANPIDGVGRKRKNDDESLSDFDKEYPGKLKNADEVEGNMVIMTDAAGLSGVTMARIAKESGAAALMVVNTDQNAGDFIYSLEPENDEEAAYAEENIDIPVVMVSLQAGNVITTAMATEDMDPNDVNKGAGLPERVRLYAGGDRPFFEDAMSGKPMVYLIHNMLTSEECDELIRMADGNYDRVDDTNGVSNYLENTIASKKRGEATAIDIDRVTLWKGGIAGKLIKDIDERMSQVTGFPAEHFSDFQVNRFKSGSSHNPHFDINPANGIMASITIFLNDIPDDQGGELVFPSPGDGAGPVIIRPRKGLAVVHHNTDEKYNFDQTTLHQELPLQGDSLAVKYVAKKFVYLNPQPQTVRIMLPLIALPFGGKLPRQFITLQNTLIEKYGLEAGDIYFQKIVSMIPFGLLLLIGSLVGSAVQKGMKKDEGKKPESSDQKGTKQKKTKSKKKD